MKRNFIFPYRIKSIALIITSMLLFFASCKNKSEENIIVVSVEPQRAILEEIVGDRYKVVTMLAKGANPETFEPGMASRLQLEQAKAYFTTGHLPFETKLKDAFNNENKTKFIDVSKGIEPVYGTHEHHHADGTVHSHRGEPDPHVWTSVRNARIMALNMLEAMKNIDPDGSEYYEERWNSLDHRLDSLDKAFSNQLSRPGINRSFAVWHPSLSYFARDYDLKQISVGYENKDMPALTLQRIVENAKADSVSVFFFQQEFDSRQATSLNNELGTELITINPLDYEWEEQLRNIVSQLCR